MPHARIRHALSHAVALALSLAGLAACHGCNDGNTPPPPYPPGSATTATTAPPPVGGGSATPPPAGSGAVVKVEDDGKTIDVARGSTVTVKLQSNAGTGYVWTAGQVDAAVLAQQGDRTSEVTSDTPGAPKMDVYRFSAVGPGSATLQMDLKRPFGSAPPARSFKVTINVH